PPIGIRAPCLPSPPLEAAPVTARDGLEAGVAKISFFACAGTFCRGTSYRGRTVQGGRCAALLQAGLGRRAGFRGAAPGREGGPGGPDRSGPPGDRRLGAAASCVKGVSVTVKAVP